MLHGAHPRLAMKDTLCCKLTREGAHRHIQDKLETAVSREVTQSNGQAMGRAAGCWVLLLPPILTQSTHSGTAPCPRFLWAETKIMTLSFLCWLLLALQTKRGTQELTLFIHSTSPAGF